MVEVLAQPAPDLSRVVVLGCSGSGKSTLAHALAQKLDAPWVQLDALLRELAPRGFHCAIGGIALPNAGSVALHERMGFAKVAHFREVGWKLGRWIDVGYWQRML